MNKLVKEKIQESQSSKGNRVIPLKEALQAVYSRPNEDFMIEKVISPLKNELEEHNAYESSVKTLVTEAMGALKNTKAFQPVAQVTYAIFLENIVAEFRPKTTEKFERSILTTIRDAKIELTKEAKRERSLRMMKEIESPSDLAATALKAQDDADALRAKEAEAAKLIDPKKDDKPASDKFQKVDKSDKSGKNDKSEKSEKSEEK